MRRSERGFTLVEIMIVVAIIALLAAIAIPNVLRGRTTANESAAIGNMRALASSLEMYRSVYQEYPATWNTDMYTNANPPFGPPSFNLDLNTGNAVVQGFLYDYARPTAQTYTLDAAVQTNARTGTRSFFTDESGVIRHCNTNADGQEAVVGENTIDQLPNACP
jgi:prepilin-type N-terminal cleavage/methylation domain-containing protein